MQLRVAGCAIARIGYESSLTIPDMMTDETIYGTISMPIAVQAEHALILEALERYLGSTCHSANGSKPVMTISLSVGESIPDAWKELQVSGKLVDLHGVRKWMQDGKALVEFCYGGGWVARDSSIGTVVGSIKPGALKNPEIVDTLVTWVLAYTVDTLPANLPPHLAALHASAVLRDGKAMLVLGNSGSGKTTICTSLLERGFSLLSDDLTIIDLSTEPLYIIPFLTFAHVNRDSLRFLPSLVKELDETEDGNGDYVIPSRKLNVVYPPPPKEAIPLSIVALGEVMPEHRTLIAPLTSSELTARGYGRLSIIGRGDDNEHEDSFQKVVSGVQHLISIRSGSDLPGAVESAFDRLTSNRSHCP